MSGELHAVGPVLASSMIANALLTTDYSFYE
jgi:hypothetical protein